VTPRQQRFVDEYLLDLNATQAAIRAGYSAKTAEVTGCRLLRNVQVAAAIEERKTARAERLEVTADLVVGELAAIAFGDLRDVVAWDADGVVTVRPSSEITDDAARALQEIAQSIQVIPQRGDAEPIEHHRLKVKRADRLRALELLGKHLGMFRERLEVEHRGLTLEQLIRMADGAGGQQ
jgi:phage terminase small subunit